MNRVIIRSFLFLCMVIGITVRADFSFKSLSCWLSGVKEQSFFEEYAFDDGNVMLLENLSGNITIKGWSLNKVAMEAIKTGSERDLSLMEITTAQYDKKLVINSNSMGTQVTIDYQIFVPQYTHLIVKNQRGTVKIKNILGTMEVRTTKGSIDIQDAANTVSAFAYGSITVSYAAIPKDSHHSLQSNENKVHIFLPNNSHATIYATTVRNSIESEHFITLHTITTMLNKHVWDNFKRNVQGTIGSGKASFVLTAYSGIVIGRTSQDHSL